MLQQLWYGNPQPQMRQKSEAEYSNEYLKLLYSGMPFSGIEGAHSLLLHLP